MSNTKILHTEGKWTTKPTLFDDGIYILDSDLISIAITSNGGEQSQGQRRKNSYLRKCYAGVK